MGTETGQRLNKLYMGEEAEKKRAAIERALAGSGYYPQLYVLTLASNDIDQLQILHSRFLLRKGLRQSLPLMVGAALGREEAFLLVGRLAAAALAENGSCDMRRFLLDTWQKEA